MFIVGKKNEQVEESLRKSIGDNNIELINNYLESYYAVMYQQDDVIACRKNLDNANIRYQNECFSIWGGLHFLIRYPKFAQLGREIDAASEKLMKCEKDFSEAEIKLAADHEKCLDSNILDRMENARFLYSSLEDSPLSDLKDLVLNNEFDVIENHLIDRVDYEVDKKYCDKKKKDYRHRYELLASQMYNVALQYRLVNKTIENNYDPEIVYDVIDTCYYALETGTKVDESRYEYLNDDILNYIKETNKSIRNNKSYKTKRR